jgi:hypothetical protein
MGFHPDKHEYRKQPAPAHGYRPYTDPYGTERNILWASNLRSDFANLARQYNSATRLPDEVLHSTGFDVPCYVIQVIIADRKGSKSLALKQLISMRLRSVVKFRR